MLIVVVAVAPMSLAMPVAINPVAVFIPIALMVTIRTRTGTWRNNATR
jgi:hypothetical protein